MSLRLALPREHHGWAGARGLKKRVVMGDKRCVNVPRETRETA
jgi:hypothetical protein